MTTAQQRSPSPAAAPRCTQRIALGSGASACERSPRFRGASDLPRANRDGPPAPTKRCQPSGCRGIAGYAIREFWALSGITRSSWVREVMSSLLNTLRRW